ncbi:hypothetical protein [Sphingomonas trueperi]|uniref:Uncharacterized protein n=1 Tax=Sphingomonas trueperi TaxID=53317 RepID=A0A7X5Y3P4_9SPHN|nr:hypothetical protein [Sphingomonas trueperi]NJB99897.1 hypothetical protein [Sphingomonas trueperi]
MSSAESQPTVDRGITVGKSWPRPATPSPLVPRWEGEFVSHGDWVNFAAKRLTVATDSNGRDLSAICVDAIGRRCANGRDFDRAEKEGTFPVRYFWDCELPSQDPVRFLPMESWDKRDEPVLLLIDYAGDGQHALDDATIAITIGHNNDHNVGPEEAQGWRFAGWCWSHDHYVEGAGKPIGWHPLSAFHALARAMEEARDQQAGVVRI